LLPWNSPGNLGVGLIGLQLRQAGRSGLLGKVGFFVAILALPIFCRNGTVATLLIFLRLRDAGVVVVEDGYLAICSYLSVSPGPMTQGVSYVHEDHKPSNLYIRNIIPIRM
jgi:hypothetical protein